VLEVLREQAMSREDVLSRFSRRSPETIRAILFDMTETGVAVQGPDGKLTLGREEEVWTDARLRDFVGMLQASGQAPSVDELAQTLGVDAERVAAILEETVGHFSVQEPEDAAFWELIRLFVEQGLLVAYREIGGETTDGFVYRIGLSDQRVSDLPRLRAVVDEARARVRRGLTALVDQTPTSEPTDTLFTATVVHLVEEMDWLGR
jgi:hypothetical protein